MGNLTETLAAQINAEHSKAEMAARTAIGHAVRVGELLTQAKAEVPHGGWMPWVESNLSFGDRQGRKYMQLFRNREQIGIENADLTIDAAVGLMASPKPTFAERLQEVREDLQAAVETPPGEEYYLKARCALLYLHREHRKAIDAITDPVEAAAVAEVALEVENTLIELQMRSSCKIGKALTEIRDERLYRGEYDTFEEYCSAKHGMDQHQVDFMISAAGAELRIMPGLVPAPGMRLLSESGTVYAAITASIKHPGYYSVETWGSENAYVDETKKPVKAEGIPAFLHFMKFPLDTEWESVPNDDSTELYFDIVAG